MILEFIKKHKYSLFFIIFFIILLPTTVSLPSQTDTRAIVTGISIDKDEEEFNIGLQLITPQSNLSNNENIVIVEDKGNSFFDCINNLAIKLGKVIGFEHTNIIIVGEGVKNEDLMNIFDYLLRNSKITLSTVIIQANKEAKKVLETSAELNNNSSSSLENNLGYNTNIIDTSNSVSLGSFYNDYFSFSKTSLIPLIETPSSDSGNSGGNQDASGQNSQGQNQTEGASGSEGQKAQIEPLIKNNGESVIYKNGRFFGIISRDLSNGFSWLDKDSGKGVVQVENVTDNKFFKNSNVSVQVERSDKNVKAVVKNNELILKTDLKLFVYVGQIVDKNMKSWKIMQSDEVYLTNELKERIKETVNKTIQNSLNYSKANKLDIFHFYDKFYKYNKNALKKVLSVYGEDYLDVCKIEVNISIFPYK